MKVRATTDIHLDFGGARILIKKNEIWNKKFLDCFRVTLNRGNIWIDMQMCDFQKYFKSV